MKAEENQPIPLWDAEGKVRLYHSIDAKEILAVPDCQYSKVAPKPKHEFNVDVIDLKIENPNFIDALPVVEDEEPKPRKKKD